MLRAGFVALYESGTASFDKLRTGLRMDGLFSVHRKSKNNASV
jgi:hypothetical protein